MSTTNTEGEAFVMDLDELLEIDRSDPEQRHALFLVEQDEALLDKLVDVRRSNDYTQAQVAERMGVSQGAIARIESGERDPHLSTLRRYAMAVGAVVVHDVGSVGRMAFLDCVSRQVEQRPYRWDDHAPTDAVAEALTG